MGFLDKVKGMLDFNEEADLEIETPPREERRSERERHSKIEDVDDGLRGVESFSKTPRVTPVTTTSTAYSPSSYSVPATGKVTPIASMDPKSRLRAITANYNIVISSPKTNDDVAELADNLKAGKPVIFNCKELSAQDGRHIYDYLCGACYVLGGKYECLSDVLYLFLPASVDVSFQSPAMAEPMSETLPTAAQM